MRYGCHQIKAQAQFVGTDMDVEVRLSALEQDGNKRGWFAEAKFAIYDLTVYII